MFFQRLKQWWQDRSQKKTYGERYAETSQLSTGEVKTLIAEREDVGQPTGVAHRLLADRSEARAKARKIDPPRPGRKTYSQRYTETSTLSNDQIRAQIAAREAQGKETGVLHRILSERT